MRSFRDHYIHRQFVIFYGFCLFFALSAGLVGGFVFTHFYNIQNKFQLSSAQFDIPTKILDIHDRLITEFFSDQKRTLVDISQIPMDVKMALLAREDHRFFHHMGFNPEAIARSAFLILTHLGFAGGSTLTQQLAGNIYANRRSISVGRKLKELFWAFELERKYSKQEILSRYFNLMPFGSTTYGIQAASEFFFDQPVGDLTPAQAALLVIQLAGPNGYYSPYKNPKIAAKWQNYVLSLMVKDGYISEQWAQYTYQNYWKNQYNWHTDNRSNAYYNRVDQAPYFSEYIRSILPNDLPSDTNIYTDGLKVYTTLNLDYQNYANSYLTRGIAKDDYKYQMSKVKPENDLKNGALPLLSMLSVGFNVKNLYHTKTVNAKLAQQNFEHMGVSLNNLLSLVFNIQDYHQMTSEYYVHNSTGYQKGHIHGALITVSDHTGYIEAMMGGTHFSYRNQFNRALSAAVSPGSSFKPLYYAVAVQDRLITPATTFVDEPVVLHNSDGKAYMPDDFINHWSGLITARYALAESKNVPAIIIFNKVGIERVIQYAAKFYGIYNPQEINRKFPKYYPLALGTFPITPLQQALAYSVFANFGQLDKPIAIRYIESRQGNIIDSPAQRTLEQEREHPNQVITRQAAYVMTCMLKSSITEGTLHYGSYYGGINFNNKPFYDGMPMAGKTGTTQNWASGWAIGFSPYMTTAIWVGFDSGGHSMGSEQSGASAAGIIFGEYMKAINNDLPRIPFVEPSTGITHEVIDKKTGLLPTGTPGEKTIHEVFLTGTEPTSGPLENQQSIEEEIYNNLVNNGLAPQTAVSSNTQLADDSMLN